MAKNSHLLIEERNNTWNTPYLFNAKELDEETGLYYYGARYYDPRVSVFYGVDPLVEQTGTPYQYCYQNPVKFIDLDGEKGRPARNNQRPMRFNSYRNGRVRYTYPNGIRPQSYAQIRSTTYNQTGRPQIMRQMPFPEYLEYYSTPNPSGYRIQMTRNNNMAKVIALIGDGSDILIQEVKKTYFGDFGPIETRSIDIVLSDKEANSLLNRMELDYQVELSTKLKEIKYEAPTFNVEKYFSIGGGGSFQFELDKKAAVDKYLEHTSQVYKEMGKSPKSILLEHVRKNMKIATTVNTRSDLPTIQSAD